MIVEILFSDIIDITKLYKNEQVENNDFGGTMTQIEYLGKAYSENILSEVISSFEDAKSLSYVGSRDRIANEIFDFRIGRQRYRAVFTIDTYESIKTRMKVKLEQIDLLDHYDSTLEDLKIYLKDVIIKDWKTCIWISDEQSEALCSELYPLFFEIENELRAFVNKVLIHNVGIGWIKQIGMEQYDISHNKLNFIRKSLRKIHNL